MSKKRIVYLVCLILSFVFVYYKSEELKKISSLLKHGEFKSILSIPLNIYKGYNMNLDKLELEINDTDLNEIKDGINKSLIRGRIYSDVKKKVKVDLQFNNSKNVKAKLRLKGGAIDHINTPRWSFRLNLNGNKEIMNMNTFSVQNPITRNFLSEYIMHLFYRKVGLFSLTYDFIEVSINGDYKGVYAIEESIGEHVIQNNQGKDGFILKIDDTYFVERANYSFLKGKNEWEILLASEIKYYDIEFTRENKGKCDSVISKFRDLILGKTSIEKVLDIDSFAKFYAASELLGAHHALRWKNFKGYYNPCSDRIEPIGFDGNSGYRINNLLYLAWKENTLGKIDLSCYEWKSIFFQNKSFVKSYFKYLQEFSSKEFLDDFFSEYKSEILKRHYAINKNDWLYVYDFSNVYYNASLISKLVD